MLDEADQLLELGFRASLERALGTLPPAATRQTLLFSATFPPDVEALSRFATRGAGRARVIDTVRGDAGGADGAGESALADATHAAVAQRWVSVPHADQLPATLRAVMARLDAADAAAESAKIIVFLPTARATQLYAAVWRALKPGLTRGAPGLELHSRKSQAARERAAALFQSAPPAGGPGAVLFTSDVSARGVDYAGVTCVVQVGGTRARARPSPRNVSPL